MTRALAWGIHGCRGRPTSRDGNYDAGLVTAVVGDISANVSIDSTRGDTAGIRNRGMMTCALVCNTDVFAAIRPRRGNTAGRVSIAAAARC